MSDAETERIKAAVTKRVRGEPGGQLPNNGGVLVLISKLEAAEREAGELREQNEKLDEALRDLIVACAPFQAANGVEEALDAARAITEAKR